MMHLRKRAWALLFIMTISNINHRVIVNFYNLPCINDEYIKTLRVQNETISSRWSRCMKSLTMFDNMGFLFSTIKIYILSPRNTFVIYTLFELVVLNFYQFTNLRSKKNKHHIMWRRLSGNKVSWRLIYLQFVFQLN